MAKLILYLLESSVILSLFYLLYVWVLRKETFFHLNRFFLLSALNFSLLFPLLSFDLSQAKLVAVETPIEEISKFRMSYYDAMALWEFNSFETTPGDNPGVEIKSLYSMSDWISLFVNALLVAYGVGIIFCLSRTVWSIRWIGKMISDYPQQRMEDVKVIKVPYPTAPFSFLSYVFVHEATVDTPEFDQILAHERTHIQEKHSIDLIFVQFLAAFLWFNPVIWLLIKSLKTTHEYIADKKIINSGYSLVEYQTLLLKQLISNNSFGLVHNFNLSFIKKRITMMNNKKSGWPGKVKVATAIAGAMICGAVIVQCNSRLEDQAIISKIKSVDDFTQGINVPVLPVSGYRFNGDSTDALNFSIAGNKLSINGVDRELSEIASVIKNGGIPSLSGHIVLRVDKDQKMKFVRDVQMELRKADRRKLLYLGRTETGAKVESVILLPPTPENAARSGAPQQPDIAVVEAEGKTDILKIYLGDNAGSVNQQKVYDFVTEHMKRKSTNYVVAAKFEDDDTYQNYLLNLAYVKDGFYQVYQERSQGMFGKDYFTVTGEEFKVIREGVPMAISISEKPDGER